MQSSVQFILAFVVVLALIGLTAWLVRRFAGNRLGANANRGRMPRLAVIDAAAVDGRRRLVLVRRDNVEHLLMIGGPSDIVVEPNIVRAMPARETAAPRAALGSELPRSAPLPDAPGWASESTDSSFEPEPAAPEPAPRPARPSFVDEARRPVLPPLPERRPEPVVSATPEPAPRPEPRVDPVVPPRAIKRSEMPRAESPRSEMPRSEPMMPRPMRADPPIRNMPPIRTERASVVTPTLPPAPAPAPTPPAPGPAPIPVAAPAPVPAPAAASAAAISAADQNLADMAQRLEAALRRPAGEPRNEAPEPRIGAPSVAPDAPSVRSAPRTPEISIASPARAEAPPVAPPVKSGFENLEDEMASLLGRPKSSS